MTDWILRRIALCISFNKLGMLEESQRDLILKKPLKANTKLWGALCAKNINRW